MFDARRREFIAALGAAAAWPLAARAQPRGAVPVIGIFVPGTKQAWGAWIAALVQRLADLGWSDPRTAKIDIRWAEGDKQRYAEITGDFVRRNVDVIVTSSTDAVIAAKRATSTIPIVFATAGDPVGAGLVASLARPGGNVTGVSNQFTDLSGKRVELLREVVPDLRRLAILGEHGNRSIALDMNAVAEVARSLGMTVLKSEIQRAEDIPPAFGVFRGQAQALYVASGPVVDSNQARLSALALADRLPTMFGSREHVEAGGLMSYGANRLRQYRRAAELVDKILRGASPAQIPVEQPTDFELVLNLKTAKALGLPISPTLLARVDAVIE